MLNIVRFIFNRKILQFLFSSKISIFGSIIISLIAVVTVNKLYILAIAISLGGSLIEITYALFQNDYNRMPRSDNYKNFIEAYYVASMTGRKEDWIEAAVLAKEWSARIKSDLL